MSGRKPAFHIKATGPTQEGKKAFWTTVGAAWPGKNGIYTLSLNEGLNLLLTKQTRLILAPVEERRNGNGGGGNYDLGDDDVPF